MEPKYVWLEKRPFGWMLRWQDAFHQRKSQFFKDEFAARGQAKMLIEQLLAQRMQAAFANDPMTVERAVEIFITTYDCQESSKRTMRYALRDFQKQFAGRDVATIRPMELDAFRTDLRDRYAPKTRGYLTFYIKALFDWLHRNAILSASPCATWKIKFDYTSAGKEISYTQEQALLRATPEYHLPKILLGIDCGMRAGAVLSLRKDAFDLRERTISFIPHKGNDDLLTLPLTARVFRSVESYVRSLSQADMRRSFGGHHGQPLWLKRPYSQTDKPDFFSKIARAMQLDRTFHDLRHTFFTRLINASGNELLANYCIGHKVKIGRYTYYHPQLEIVREAFLKMEAKTVASLETLELEQMVSIRPRKENAE